MEQISQQASYILYMIFRYSLSFDCNFDSVPTFSLIALFSSPICSSATWIVVRWCFLTFIFQGFGYEFCFLLSTVRSSLWIEIHCNLTGLFYIMCNVVFTYHLSISLWGLRCQILPILDVHFGDTDDPILAYKATRKLSNTVLDDIQTNMLKIPY